MTPRTPIKLLERLRRLVPRGERSTDAPATDHGQPADQARVGDARLIVCFSDADWRLALVGETDGVVMTTRNGMTIDAASLEAAPNGAVEGLRAALHSLTPGERASIENIELYPIDPQIEIFDNRSIRAFSPDKEALRSIADNLTGSADSAFDSTPLGAAEADRRLVAVCKIEVLRRYIAATGDLAPKLTRIAPAQVREAGDAAKRNRRSDLYLGAHATAFCALDPANGVFAMRTADVGVADFAKLVADVNSLPLNEAAREMADRDMLARAVTAGMDTPLAAIAGLVRETLAYVSESRLAELPDRVQISGPLTAVCGLAGLLEERLGVPVEPIDADQILSGSDDVGDGMNLLRSSVGPMFTEGTREYAFDGARFVGSELARRKEATPKRQAPQSPQAKAAPRKFFGVEIGDLSGGLTPKRAAGLAAGGAALLAFAAYDMLIAPKAAAVSLATSRLQTEQASAQVLTTQLMTLRSTARRDALAAGVVDKVLWAEKFVSIARALPPSLRLTGAAIRADNRRVGQVEVVATKLAMTGVASSTGRRRLQDIAAFIEALENDAAFMRDFRAITFAGLGGEDVEATFEIHAWYDENKRREQESAPDASSNPLQAAREAAAAKQRATPSPEQGFKR